MAAGDGLIVMTPTSINVTGTSGSINADGGVDFTAVTSLSLNGVFTSAYDNYLIVLLASASTSAAVRLRLRTSGTDASGSNYTAQYVRARSTTVDGARATSLTEARLGDILSNLRTGMSIHMYGPALAQPTALRVVSSSPEDSATIDDYVDTHSLSTSYDGFTIFPASNNITGNIVVFGYEE